MQTTMNCSSPFPHPPTHYNPHHGGRHLCLDNFASPQAQSSTPLHPFERLSLHGPVSHCRGRHGIIFFDCEEPGGNLRWQNILYHHHHCCGPILQIFPPKHLQDPAFSHKGWNWTPGPGAGHLLHGLLTLDWTPSLCDKPLQSIQNSTAHLLFSLPPPPWPPLAFCCSPHQV